MRDERDLAQSSVYRRHGVLHVVKKRTTADHGAVDVTGTEAHIFRGFSGKHAPRAEDAVNIALAKTSVGNRVPRRLHVELQRRFMRQGSQLVGFGYADNSKFTGKIFEVCHARSLLTQPCSQAETWATP